MSKLVEESLILRGRYDEEPSHSDQVAKLALQIFDGLRVLADSTPHHRELLHSAALLHDIGWSQTPDGKGHHKWSAKLIQEYSWKNLSKDEIRIVAQIARYHRKSIPKPDHADFQNLPGSAQKLVMLLGGTLRIADALDRTHSNKISDLTVSVSKDSIVIKVQPAGLWEAELAMFDVKKEMIELAAKTHGAVRELNLL